MANCVEAIDSRGDITNCCCTFILTECCVAAALNVCDCAERECMSAHSVHDRSRNEKITIIVRIVDTFSSGQHVGKKLIYASFT